LSQLLNRLKSAIKYKLDAIINRRLQEEIGRIVSERVKTRTRLGKGVNEDGAAPVKLKVLSDAYKRRRKAEKNQLHAETTPSKSNLTFTGDMLDNIKYRIEGDKIIIYIEGDLNNKKAQWVTEGGRAFMNLSKPEQVEIIRLIRERIKQVTR
jgi:hypothetical protein